MDVVKPSGTQIPALYQRPLPLVGGRAQRPTSGEDVVDCVEISIGRFLPASATAIRYAPFATPIREKGTLIDLFI